jgi:hypothetical protein
MPRALQSLKTRVGALVYDWPRLEMSLRGLGPYRDLRTPWIGMRNRNERLVIDGRGARCEWVFTSDLHIARVFPSAGARLMRRALRDWPIEFRDTMTPSDRPSVSFIIGHRGVDRLPHLLATLQSVAAQRDVDVECIVVEQSTAPQIVASLPPWVRHLHTPLPALDYPYNRSWAFNAGARLALGEVLILHDNDMLCPFRYAAEAIARAREGWSFLELKRFLFYFDEGTTREVFATPRVPDRTPENVLQNALGGSIAVTRDAFFDVGGFDESFVGWGGEDNEFWERAETTKAVNAFGYLPFAHLWHAPQSGKQSAVAPAVRRYHELKDVPAEARIEKLRRRDWGSPLRPAGGE